jgi:hypothetical protein
MRRSGLSIAALTAPAQSAGGVSILKSTSVKTTTKTV